MTKIVIRPKYPNVSHVTPMTLSMPMTKDARAQHLLMVNTNFKNIREWLHVKRNYTT